LGKEGGEEIEVIEVVKAGEVGEAISTGAHL